MPSKPKRAKGERRARQAAVVIVLLVALGVGYLALRHTTPASQRVTACVAGPDGRGLQLTNGQAAVAATIAGVASKLDMPGRAVAIAYATALQESKLTDLHYGDLDSVGVFQQRPSEGWGTTREIEDPVYATTRFFEALAAVPRYRHLPIDIAAQDVQRSADGAAYAQYAAMGTEMAAAFTGSQPQAVWCTYSSAPGKARLSAAAQALNSAFGPLSSHKTGDPAMTVTAGKTSQGWAVAAWLVSHAASYGITSVRYRGYQWFGFTGAGRWTREPARARVRAAPTAVVFG